MVDSLGLGGAQAVLRGYFGARRADVGILLYALRTVPRQARVDHPNVIVNPSPARYSLLPLLELRRIVRREGIGALHCHLFRAQVFGFLLKRLFFPPIALVFHEHGRVAGREGEPALEAAAFRWFLRAAWRDVDRFACVSEHTRSRLLEVVPGAASATTVVPNPVALPCGDPAGDRAELRRALGVPAGAFVAGFAARLVERKGWRDFLDAVARLAVRVPVHFLLAGDGEDRARLEARVRELGLAGRGRVLGHVEAMGAFYESLDCFVMPSRWEPHGLAHLEAQRFGVPAIVAGVPGLGSTVHPGTDALVFAPGDVDALAACIERLARDTPLRERLAAGGRANASRYTIEAFATALDHLHAGLRRGA